MKKNKGILVIIVAVIFIFLSSIIINFAIKHLFYPLKYKDEVLTYSNKYGVDPYLIFAIINSESGFNKDAVSSKNAKGLMQITQETAKEINDEINSTDELTDTNIFDENINVEIGCKYFASLVDRYNGNYYLAICAYNAGIGNVNSWIDDGKVSSTLDTTNVELPFSETTNYLRKVINNYDMYKKLYPNFS